MFASLNRIDIELESVDGRQQVMQIDHRNAEQIAAVRELSTVFALLRLLTPRRFLTPDPVVVHYLATAPPDFLIAAVASAGGRVRVAGPPTGPSLAESPS